MKNEIGFAKTSKSMAIRCAMPIPKIWVGMKVVSAFWILGPFRGEEGTLNASAGVSPVRSKSSRKKQDNENDQNDSDDSNAAVTEAIAVAAEAATEATEQKNDKDDNENKPERHDVSPVAASNRNADLVAKSARPN